MEIFYLALIILFVIIGSIEGFLLARYTRKPQEGDPAPDFTLVDDTGKLRTLSEFKGKKVVLYFYPKDNTSGCTQEACSLRDNYATFAQHNIVILGISYDSVASHKAFKAAHQLPFTLLSDTKKTVAKKYGAATYWFFWTLPVPKRMTFIINEQGVITHILRAVDPTTHTDMVLKNLNVTQ